jgi:signal transduction histidine kinase/CheY-like chemotaxis protein
MSPDKVVILNVNDNEAQRYTVTQILRNAGYEVWEASTGGQALELAANGPDIVVLDIRLPDISGLEVCRRIKADPRTASMTVIHLSATFVKGEDKARGLEGGADGYLTSPVGQAELLATVHAFVRIRQTEATQRFLASATAAMTSTLEVEKALHSLARLAVPFLGEWCIVHRLHDDGSLEVTALVHSNEEDVYSKDVAEQLRQNPELVDDVARVIRATATAQTESGAPVRIDEGAEPSLLMRALGASAHLCVPLVARGRTLGTLTLVAIESGRTYGPRERSVAEELAQRAAVCVDNARLYEEAQRALTTRENLLAIVSHDLKNPLGAISLANTLITRRLGQDESLAPYLKHTEVIRKSAERMDRLIHDLLDLASIDAGRLAMERQPTELAPLVQEASDAQAPFAQAKGVRLAVKVDAELPRVHCDSERIQQVLGNLLTNALKFTPEGGSITIDVVRRYKMAEVSVIDTGSGIKAEHLAQLFERFWQASKSNRVGVGLGLSIVKGIVEAHGGEIGVRSVVGTGSTFVFTLPFAP